MNISSIGQPVNPYAPPAPKHPPAPSGTPIPTDHQQGAGTQATQAARPVEEQLEGGDVLSNDERNYFAALFPEAGAEIKGAQVYSRTGHQKTGRMGTLIDRRG
jgi:hypothetical protein